MGQNINKFWSGYLGLRSSLDYSQYWDFQIGEDDYILRRLNKHTDPIIWFDSNSGTTIDCSDANVSINSLVRWNNAPISAFTINDIGLTGIDTQYVNQISGVTLSFTGNETLLLKKIGGNLLFDSELGPSPIYYGVETDTDYSGQYYQGTGGFFQGFFKLHDYPFELMPTRMEKGWTMEFMLKMMGCCDNLVGNIATEEDNCVVLNEVNLFNIVTEDADKAVTLNKLYPENNDIFFLIGTRAENKFWNNFSGETNVTTSSGIPLAPESGTTEEPSNSIMYWNEILPIGCGEPETTNYGTTTNKDPNFDIINNVLAFRLDCKTNKIGYRKVAFSGICTYDDITTMTGGTHMSAIAVVEEKMSDNPITISATCSAQTWVHIVVKFVRDFTLTGCDLVNRGGINDIDFTESSTYLKLLKYQDEANWRKGKLIFYVNGKKHFVVDDFEEIIPRQLDTHKEKQQGVPYNISWGGGTQGLLESVTVSGWTGGIEQDMADYKLLLEKNFAGNWCGGYSVLKIYDKPLENFEIVNNFCSLIDRFQLQRLNCCQCLPNNPYNIN